MPLGYTSKILNDYLGQTDTRDAARRCTWLHQHISGEHDGTAGTHLGSRFRTSGGTVSESGGAYTLKDSYGLVSGVTDLGVGQVQIDLSDNLIEDVGRATFWYPVDVLIHDALGICYVSTRLAASFVVNIYDENGALQDTGFSFTLGGLPA